MLGAVLEPDAVVAGHDDQRLIVDPLLLEPVDDGADERVRVGDVEQVALAVAQLAAGRRTGR
jgi:hypothetical protein